MVSAARLTISQSAPAARQLARSPPPDRPCPAAVAQTRIGSIMSAAVWYSDRAWAATGSDFASPTAWPRLR